MPKTYNTFTNVSTGDVLTATNFNNVLTNIANYRVPPSCVLTKGQQTIPATTTTSITYSSEQLDTDGMHDNNTNESRITINTAGLYQVTAGFRFAATGNAGSRVLCFINKNTVEVLRHDIVNPTNNAEIAFSITSLVECSVNDYLEMAAYVDVQRVLEGGRFTAVWVGQVS